MTTACATPDSPFYNAETYLFGLLESTGFDAPCDAQTLIVIGSIAVICVCATVTISGAFNLARWAIK